MNKTKLDVFRHYKGTHYVKLCEARHTETGEIMVVYVSSADGEIWTRPKEMFESRVDSEKDRFLGPRFFQINGE